MKSYRLLIAILAPIALFGCGQKDKIHLEGERESVFLNADLIKVDAGAEKTSISLPAPILNDAWDQASGSADHAVDPVQLKDRPVLLWETSIGGGSGQEKRLINAPVAAEDKVFAMDVEGRVSALNLNSGALIWEMDSSPAHGMTQPISGGLCYHEGSLYVTTAGAELIKLDAKTGAVLWKATVSAPVRASPTVIDGRIFVVSINNQLEVFSEDSGTILWSHHGITEAAGLLGGAKVAVQGGAVVVPYTSGEVFALRADTGYPLWNEMLSVFNRVDSVSSLAHIKARPVIDQGLVVLMSHAGRITALQLRDGKALWSKDVGGTRTPAVSGGFIFFVTNDQDLVCMTLKEGRILWIKQLPQYKKEEKLSNVLWAGPILAGNRLVLSGSNGDAIFVSTQDGQVMETLKLPSGTLLSPIIVKETLIFMLEDGTVVAYR
jgi:outer membrane protein assembly factor BamB